MFAIILFFLLLGIPIAAVCSLLAGLKIRVQNKTLAGLVIAGAIASGITFLWEMRYDIELVANLLGHRLLDLAVGTDPDLYFLTLYGILFLAILFARFRWKPEYGSAVSLNLALIFWPLAGLPYLILEPGMFAP